MGDKSLMKNTILMVMLFTVSLNADLTVQKIEKMISKIHEKRPGANLEVLGKTKEPFVNFVIENNTTELGILDETKETKISLHAIVNGKAYINDSWKSIDDVIMGYKLKYIGKRGVVLRNGKHIKKLFLHKKRDNFITIEGR